MTTRLTDEQIAELERLEREAWVAPWTARTFEIDCPCPNGEHCGCTHTCEEVEAPEAYPASPEDPAEKGDGQCVVQISVPGLESLAGPTAAFIAAARNALPSLLAEVRASRSSTSGPPLPPTTEDIRRALSPVESPGEEGPAFVRTGTRRIVGTCPCGGEVAAHVEERTVEPRCLKCSAPAAAESTRADLAPDYDVIEAAYLASNADGAFRAALDAAFHQGLRAAAPREVEEVREALRRERELGRADGIDEAAAILAGAWDEGEQGDPPEVIQGYAEIALLRGRAEDRRRRALLGDAESPAAGEAPDRGDGEGRP